MEKVEWHANWQQNCPISEQTADGATVGRCWFFLYDKKTCERHGDVSKALERLPKLTLERDHYAELEKEKKMEQTEVDLMNAVMEASNNCFKKGHDDALGNLVVPKDESKAMFDSLIALGKYRRDHKVQSIEMKLAGHDPLYGEM